MNEKEKLNLFCETNIDIILDEKFNFDKYRILKSQMANSEGLSVKDSEIAEIVVELLIKKGCILNQISFDNIINSKPFLQKRLNKNYLHFKNQKQFKYLQNNSSLDLASPISVAGLEDKAKHEKELCAHHLIMSPDFLKNG
ncbi:MAG: hypothetical protein PHC61_02490 [Chitinivibrionales bacterium]|nr:hypothetical protein [Chitinivibrionales bacterium]